MGAIGVFIVGSALCGASQSFVMLVVSRGVQGVGGGGIIQLVQITVSDIVPLQQRGKYAGLLGAMWGVASYVSQPHPMTSCRKPNTITFLEYWVHSLVSALSVTRVSLPALISHFYPFSGGLFTDHV